MKFKKLLPIAFAGLFLVSGCTNLPDSIDSQTSQQTQITNSHDAKIQVVTSFYPLAEIANQVGGTYVEVKNLTPPGAEPHDFEPSPRDVLSLNTADLVMVNGVGFEPWAEKILPTLEGNNVKVLDVSKVLPELLQSVEESEDEASGDTDEDHKEQFKFDPHFWLDPISYITQVEFVSTTLSEIDPVHSDDFTKQANAFVGQLGGLHKEFTDGLSSCKLKVFVTNHAAFGYLAKRYGLTMLPISGLSPDSEPSAKRLGELTELVKKEGVKIVFSESLMSPKVSETLAKEAGVQVMVLNPLEGLADNEIAAGENYISVMKKNLQSLRTALECT